MPLNVKTLSRAAFGLALVALLAVSQDAAAQQTLTGDWTASLDKERPEKIHLTFERRTAKGGRNQMGQSYDFAELQGLTREQAAAGGAVKFSLVREAGRIDCEGSFRNGKGSGTFRFTGNPGFVSAMKGRGFDFEKDSSTKGDERETEERLFAATALNVTTAQADDLLSAGFGKLDVDDLFKAAIFKVDSAFAREMKASGFGDLGMEELVKARIFKVDPDFARQVVQTGLGNQSLENLVQMKIFKVTPEFIAQMRIEGLTNLTVGDLIQMRIHKIDAEFIRQARADGVPLEVNKLVERRIHGIRTR
jgi:hypothetical protein